MNSRNLIMFTSIGSWFWRYCAGIRLDGNSGRVLRSEPLLPSPELELGIHSMDASYASIRGLIRVAWERSQSQPSHPLRHNTTVAGSGFDRMTVHITVPHNVRARVRLPHPHPSQSTELQQLWEYEASEGSAAARAQSSRQQLFVERVAGASECEEAFELLISYSPSTGVRCVCWLSDERVVELQLSSGSFGFDLTFAQPAAAAQPTAGPGSDPTTALRDPTLRLPATLSAAE